MSNQPQNQIQQIDTPEEQREHRPIKTDISEQDVQDLTEEQLQDVTGGGNLLNFIPKPTEGVIIKNVKTAPRTVKVFPKVFK